MKKAFTLIEIMIVIVIIGLLAAMIIPAFQKVKYDALEKRIKSGNYSNEDYEQYMRAKSEPGRVNVVTDNKVPSVVEIQKITINGRVYYMIPNSDDIKINEINGQKFLMVPTTP